MEELTGRKKILPRELFFAKIQHGGEIIDRGMVVFLPGSALRILSVVSLLLEKPLDEGAVDSLCQRVVAVLKKLIYSTDYWFRHRR